MSESRVGGKGAHGAGRQGLQIYWHGVGGGLGQEEGGTVCGGRRGALKGRWVVYTCGVGGRVEGSLPKETT